MVQEPVVRADCIIIRLYALKLTLTQTALVIQIQSSVKENRIHPQLAPVALTIVTLKHKHKRILTNPLLRLTKQT